MLRFYIQNAPKMDYVVKITDENGDIKQVHYFRNRDDAEFEFQVWRERLPKGFHMDLGQLVQIKFGLCIYEWLDETDG